MPPGNWLSPRSLPVRGAWIEIYSLYALLMSSQCRSPCGERGLKCLVLGFVALAVRSLPVRGAWIEIYSLYALLMSSQSLPVRGAWIEIVGMLRTMFASTSLPVRGAWIEIALCAVHRGRVDVAPRAGSVD